MSTRPRRERKKTVAWNAPTQAQLDGDAREARVVKIKRAAEKIFYTCDNGLEYVRSTGYVSRFGDLHNGRTSDCKEENGTFMTLTLSTVCSHMKYCDKQKQIRQSLYGPTDN